MTLILPTCFIFTAPIHFDDDTIFWMSVLFGNDFKWWIFVGPIFRFPSHLWTLTFDHTSITLCLSRQQHTKIRSWIDTNRRLFLHRISVHLNSVSLTAHLRTKLHHQRCFAMLPSTFCHPFTGQRHRFQLLFLLKQQQFGRVYLWHIVHRFLITTLAPISVLYHQRQQSSYSRISIWPTLSQ